MNSSVADFVLESAAPGRDLPVKKVDSGDFANGTTTYTYNGSKQLTKQSDTTGTIYTFTAWDSQDRPTKGTLVISQCKSATLGVTVAYDAKTFTKTMTLNDPSSKCLAADRITEDLYNASGDWIGQVQNPGSSSPTKVTLTYKSTKKVCK